MILSLNKSTTFSTFKNQIVKHPTSEKNPNLSNITFLIKHNERLLVLTRVMI